MLANFGNIDTTVHIRLEYDNGHSQMVSVSVPGQGQMLFDVNQANSQPVGTCDTSLCQTTPTASIEVTADGPIVSERLMYFHFGPKGITGTTDVVGTPAAQTTYAFAEGYTLGNFSEFLTVQNPNATAETLTVTYKSADLNGATPVVSVSGWNVAKIDVAALATAACRAAQRHAATAAGVLHFNGPSQAQQDNGVSPIESAKVNIKVHKGDVVAIDTSNNQAEYCSDGTPGQLTFFNPILAPGDGFRSAQGVDTCLLLVQAVIKH